MIKITNKTGYTIEVNEMYAIPENESFNFQEFPDVTKFKCINSCGRRLKVTEEIQTEAGYTICNFILEE